MKQHVKIIAGLYRGKNISFPEVPHLRPTPQRVRETVFNWLMHDIKGARVCDAFAGSGALGFEALSRGALEVTLLEKSPLAVKFLKENAQGFKNASLEVIETDAFAFLKTTPKRFDIIFLDPPFSEAFYGPLFELLATHEVLASGGLLYVESPEIIDAPPAFSCHRQKRAGQVVYSLYNKQIKNQPIA